MQQIYFIRHGNADYREGCLTPLGVKQRDSLIEKLSPLLLAHFSYALVSSSSSRVTETAEPFVELIKRKTGQRLDLITERVLGEMQAIGSFKKLTEDGTRNLALIDRYQNSDIGLFFSHEKIIASTSIALAEKLGISLPEQLRLIEEKIDDEELIKMIMQRHKCSRADVDLICKQNYKLDPMKEFPYIAEASAIHFDLARKQVEYILP